MSKDTNVLLYIRNRTRRLRSTLSSFLGSRQDHEAPSSSSNLDPHNELLRSLDEFEKAIALQGESFDDRSSVSVAERDADSDADSDSDAAGEASEERESNSKGAGTNDVPSDSPVEGDDDAVGEASGEQEFNSNRPQHSVSIVEFVNPGASVPKPVEVFDSFTGQPAEPPQLAIHNSNKLPSAPAPDDQEATPPFSVAYTRTSSPPIELTVKFTPAPGYGAGAGESMHFDTNGSVKSSRQGPSCFRERAHTSWEEHPDSQEAIVLFSGSAQPSTSAPVAAPTSPASATNGVIPDNEPSASDAATDDLPAPSAGIPAEDNQLTTTTVPVPRPLSTFRSPAFYGEHDFVRTNWREEYGQYAGQLALPSWDNGRWVHTWPRYEPPTLPGAVVPPTQTTAPVAPPVPSTSSAAPGPSVSSSLPSASASVAPSGSSAFSSASSNPPSAPTPAAPSDISSSSPSNSPASSQSSKRKRSHETSEKDESDSDVPLKKQKGKEKKTGDDEGKHRSGVGSTSAQGQPVAGPPRIVRRSTRTAIPTDIDVHAASSSPSPSHLLPSPSRKRSREPEDEEENAGSDASKQRSERARRTWRTICLN